MVKDSYERWWVTTYQRLLAMPSCPCAAAAQSIAAEDVFHPCNHFKGHIARIYGLPAYLDLPADFCGSISSARRFVPSFAPTNHSLMAS